MTYLSCEWIEYRLVLDHWELKFCCKPHSGNKGFVPICHFSGGPLPVETIRNEREKLRKLNNTKGADSPCGGCHHLKSGDWPDLEGNALFNQVEISNFTICNLRCNYCYTVLHKEWHLPPYAYELRPIFSEMIEKGYLHDQTRIEWAGGEPTILEDFEDLQKMFVAKGYCQTIFTNAVVFSEGIAQGLRDHKMSIVTSVDSGTPETFRKVKGRDYFHRVWHNLDKYIQTGGDLVIKYVVKDDNMELKDLNGFLRLCRKYRAPMISIAPDNNEVSVNRVLDATLKGAAYMAWKARWYYGLPCEIQNDYFEQEQRERLYRYMHTLEIAKFKIQSWVAKRFTFLFKQSIKELKPTSEEIKPELVTGCWYTPAEPGTVVCIEIQGVSLYLTINCYNEAGDPVWYTSFATETDRNSFTGVLSQWTGWPLGETRQEPKETEVGKMSLLFLDANQAKITVRAGEFPKDRFIEKYMPRVTRKSASPNLINGWWYDPVDWGMGFFFEVLDDHFLMIWNHYDQNRVPRWWISGGGESFFDSKSSLYTGLVQEWFGGQTITGHYRTHQIHEHEPVKVCLDANGMAIVEWNQLQFQLERHKFGSSLEHSTKIANQLTQTTMKPIENGFAIHKNEEITGSLRSVSHYANAEPGVTVDPSFLEKDLGQYLNDDPYPLPLTSDREGYHGNAHYDYWLSGLKDYLSIKHLITRHVAGWPENAPVFDLGCASGRVIRHFLCHEHKMAIWGADINNRHVEWIRRYLPGSVIVFQNSTLPHVPVEDNTFALVYGFSVITHIDHFETAWLLEIRRMLKKNGYAYLSFHSEHTWEIMGPPLPVYNALAENNEYIKEYDIGLELFKQPMPKAKTVFTCSKDDIYNCNVFYTIDYIRKEWGKIFKVVGIMHEYHDYQDVVLLQKV